MPGALQDDGYRPTAGALAFLHLTPEQLKALAGRRYPLGTSESSFKHFVESLGTVLAKSGVTTCDVRLQGSSAHLFSSKLKQMPWTRDAIVELLEELQDRSAEAFEIDQVLLDLEAAWPRVEPRPTRRLFDALYRLKIDVAPSDLDVQISSAELYAAALDRARLSGHSMPEERLCSPTYAFVKKRYIRDVAPLLDWWSSRQSQLLRRQVSVAVFDATGPPTALDPTAVSSHFRDDSDWILNVDLGSLG
jgi:hypothetical protein